MMQTIYRAITYIATLGMNTTWKAHNNIWLAAHQR